MKEKVERDVTNQDYTKNGVPNWKNRTLFHGDNLEFMRAMNSSSVHLIATDPPFNKGRDFHATPDSLTSGASFQDRWSWEKDVHEEWKDQISDDHPNVWHAIESAQASYGDDMGAFLCFMAVRLVSMHRILRSDGSIYLHCDPTASHYLKMLMDGIFGRRNFRNEIVWHYAKWSNNAKKFQSNHDVILFYGKSEQSKFNVQYRLSEDKKRKLEKGYQINVANGIRQLIYYNENVVKFVDKSRYDTLVDRTKKNPGSPMPDVWSDINILNSQAKERVDYPTQKPLALYERIIKASSNEMDIVFDPFAGCATTCIAAERLGRQWVGIDLWKNAEEVVLDRLEKEGLKAPKYTRRNERNKQVFLFPEDMHFTSELPSRTDDGAVAAPSLLPTFKHELAPWEKLTKNQILQELRSAQSINDGYVLCAGCGREMEPPFMELDHVTPNSDGGANDISNRILLCRPCNGIKSNKITISGLRRSNKASGWMQDEQLAERASALAKQKYHEVRYSMR